jgi:hypothetical protein
VKYLASGTVIGTTGSFNNSSNTRDKVFDLNVSTYFDAPNADGSWVGLDLGTAKVITALRYYPRTGWGTRMVGGVFQGSNIADFSTSTTLARVLVNPLEGAYTTVPVDDSTSYRYVRYLSPNGSYCNITELLFYGVVLPAAPGNLNARLLDGTASLSWSSTAYANTYKVKRSTTNGGPYTVVSGNLATTTFSESGLTPGATYYYVVSAENEAGESANSAQATASDGYAQWAAQQGIVAGSPNGAFDADANGNGIPNGVEYALPAGLNVVNGAQTSTITAVIRSDASVSAALLKSTDMVNWTPVNFSVAADQNGVPAGYTRWTADDPLAPAEVRKFYKLRLTR